MNSRILSAPSHSPPSETFDRVGQKGTSSTRYQWLDSWRGIACVMLIVYHAMFYVAEPVGPLAGDAWNFAIWVAKRMWLGVPIFFVISGYCIAGSVRSLQSKPGGLRQFAQRRFFRIYPPLWAACALSALLWLAADTSTYLSTHCLQIKGAGALSIWQWIGNLTATESWLYHAIPDSTGPNYLMGIIWTLCYEEQFYFVAALMLVIFKGRTFAGAALLTVFAIALFLTGVAAHPGLAGIFLDGHWLLFAFGWAAHHAIHEATRRTRTGLILLLILTVGAALMDMRGEHSDTVLQFDLSLASASAFALLLIGAHSWDAQLSQSRIFKPIAAVGKMSYSIYLTHYAPVTLISAAFAGVGLRGHSTTLMLILPLCLFTSWLIGRPFYLAIERRFSTGGVKRQTNQENPSRSLAPQKMPC